MKYRTIGTDPARTREVSALALGAMWFGTRTDEAAAFGILDRFAEAGGTFVDTSNNYAFWANGTQGGESETVLGRWLADRGVRDRMVVATKVGARPVKPARDFGDIEGLSPAVVREQADRSRERLGVEQLDVYYAHLRDPGTPVAEQADGLAALVDDGTVGLLGASNYWVWELERWRAHAAGRPSFDVLQFQHTYLRPRTDLPGLAAPEGTVGAADGQLLSWLADSPEVALVAYSPLLKGMYTREEVFERPTGFDHPGVAERLAALDDVVRETGATRNQVVIAWLLGAPVPAIPLVGASSVAQLDEVLGGVDLELTEDQRTRLDGERVRV
jgi:aryl-alcohol dehydrogenase-like predicted oxidoreductase